MYLYVKLLKFFKIHKFDYILIDHYRPLHSRMKLYAPTGNYKLEKTLFASRLLNKKM